VYGAIELQSLPHFKLKEWKRLGDQGAFEPNMTTAPITLSLERIERVSLQDTADVENLLEAACMLLALKGHVHFDATALRGLYVTQSLHAHHVALQHALSEGRAAQSSASTTAVTSTVENVSESQLLLQVFVCDTTAALGALTEAVACYHSTSALLAQYMQRLPSLAVGSSALPLALGRDQLTSLHCGEHGVRTVANSSDGSYGDRFAYWNCQLRTMQLRQARLLLLYAVDPLSALSILQLVSAKGVTSTQAEIWRLLAQAMLEEYRPSATRAVSVASLGEECGAILAELAWSSDYSLVHALFAQICAKLQHSSARSADAVDQARPMVASLLSIGAVIPAAVHVRQVVRAALGLPRLPLDDAYTVAQEQLWTLLHADPAVERLICNTDNSSDGIFDIGAGSAVLATLAGSDNLRAAVLLYLLVRDIQADSALWRIFLRDGDLMSLLLGALLQVTAPVTLNLSPYALNPDGAENESFCTPSLPPCFIEALLLRKITVDVLQDLVGACSNPDSACALSDPVSNVGARGLFLLAYQGLSLLPLARAPKLCTGTAVAPRDDADCVARGEPVAEVVQEASLRYLLRDSTVPSLYAQLLEVTQRNDPYSSPTSSYAPSINSTAASEGGAAPTLSGSQQGHPHQTTEFVPVRTPAKIRVGFLSFFFRKHPVGRLLSPIIVGLDRSLFDVYVITKSDTPRSVEGGGADAITRYLHTHVQDEKWVLIDHNSVSTAERVRALQLDIIVYGDVFMDSYVAHLAVQRLAPVQVAFWGHPFTTGYNSIDYFISSDLFEAPNAHTRYARTCLFSAHHAPRCLPPCWCCYVVCLAGTASTPSSWCVLTRCPSSSSRRKAALAPAPVAAVAAAAAAAAAVVTVHSTQQTYAPALKPLIPPHQGRSQGRHSRPSFRARYGRSGRSVRSPPGTLALRPTCRAGCPQNV
jgi:hypothetical protein